MKRRNLTRLLWLIAVLTFTGWSAQGSDFYLGRLFGSEGRRQIGRFVSGMFPPEVSPSYLAGLVVPALETIQMSFLGMVFGAVLAAPLALLASRITFPVDDPGASAVARTLGAAAYHSSRALLNLLRTIPDLVWALVFISAVGLGPFAGVLALTVTSAGLLGKLYAEAMESVDPTPVEALNAMGAGRVKTALWGVLPQAATLLVSLTLFRWECNIRAAMVVGFVGAGGLGGRIDIAMRLFRYDEVLTLLAALLLLVALVDRTSAYIRGRLTLKS